jgi:hypothetical protein
MKVFVPYIVYKLLKNIEEINDVETFYKFVNIKLIQKKHVLSNMDAIRRRKLSLIEKKVSNLDFAKYL